MERYRSYGEKDDKPKEIGDGAFIGVDEYNGAENINPGNVQKAVNLDFSSKDAVTRGGFVCLPQLGVSTNNLTWVRGVLATGAFPTNTSGDYLSVTYGKGLFVAGGSPRILSTGSPIIYYPNLAYSYDGINWAYCNCLSFAPDIGTTSYTLFFPKLTFSNNQFFAIRIPTLSDSVVRCFSSADGIVWNSGSAITPFEAGSAFTVTSLTAVNGRLIATAIWQSTVTDGLNTATRWECYTSVDNGVTWTRSGIIRNSTLEYTTLTTGEGTNQTVTYGNGVYVFGGLIARNRTGAPDIASYRGLYYSYDLVTWTENTYFNGTVLSDGIFSNGRFIYASGAFSPIKYYVSTDAVNWSVLYEKNVASSGLYEAATFAAGNGFLLASVFDQITGSYEFQTIRSSIAGSDWPLRSLNAFPTAFYRIYSFAYGNGAFVAVGGLWRGATAYISTNPTGGVSALASGLYSDPDDAGVQWIMMLGYDFVGFYKFGRTSRTVSLGSHTVTERSTIVQANNQVYIFRGPNQKPLYWDGDWSTTFAEVPNTTLPSSFASIPNSSQATYYQNRLWVLDGKDSIAASDVLSFTDYDPQANEFNLNTGSSDYVVATFPFGINTLVVFKNKSIIALNNVEGSLLDVTATEVTRQVGLVGPNAITSVGPDLAYVSYGDINLLTLTATNNALQHKTLPLSARIRKIMSRVNWDVGSKISLGYWSNKLYVALPLDNSQVCNTVVVYNFITDQWYGEWNFSSTMNMCIQGWQVTEYLGLQRLHAITEDGRIFVTDEGQNDISGTTVAEISSELVTRAYVVEEGNHFQRRIYLDVATNRPKLSCSVYTEGANEESVLLTDQTYTRAESWKFADTAYDLTNANNDYNRAYRKDYSTGPDSVQPGSGFEPEMTQELRLPLLARRQGRLSWIKVTNTQGFISVMSLAFETRSGQRANFVQV